MAVSTRMRQQAQLEAARTTGIENRGLRAAVRRMASVRRETIAQFVETGEITDLRKLLEPVFFELRDMMVVSYLTSRRRLPEPLRLSVFDAAVEFFARLNPDGVEQAVAQFAPVADEVVRTLATSIDRSLTTAVAETVRQQLPTRQAVRELRKRFAATGTVSGSDFRLETVFRTQAQAALNAGKWQRAQDPDVNEILWGYTYVTVGDDRVRETHEVLDGTTLPKSDPFWRLHWPPNGWNCRCVPIELFDAEPMVEPGRIEGVVPDPDKGFDGNTGFLLNRNAA